jgi:hypothetical protein
MLIRNFESEIGRITIKWDKDKMQIFLNNQLLKNWLNSENTGRLDIVLDDGNNLEIHFGLTQTRSRLNVYYNGRLLEGSSDHYLSIIDRFKYLNFIVGLCFLGTGIYSLLKSQNHSQYQSTDWITSILGACLLLIAEAFRQRPSMEKYMLFHSLILFYSIILYLSNDLDYATSFLLWSIPIFFIWIYPYRSLLKLKVKENRS